MDDLCNMSFVMGMLKIALECLENDADGLSLVFGEKSGLRMKVRIEFDEISLEDPTVMKEARECINRIYGAKEDE